MADKCPNCGYCPHCRWSSQPPITHPYFPSYPYYPYAPYYEPWIVWSSTGTSNEISING